MNILSAKEIENIKKCGRVLKAALDKVALAVAPGVTASQLNQIAEDELHRLGAVPSFKNYFIPGGGTYPSSLCVSINSEVVHGLPTENKVLKEGDIVSLDLGAIFLGVCTDMAVTKPVGRIDPDLERLLAATKHALDLGIKEVKKGNRIGDISHAVQTYIETMGFSVVRDLVGHGIGTKPHTDPQIPNYGQAGRGPIIQNGMALAIEPMATNGSYQVNSDPDGWTIRTADGSYAAHFEHTVVIDNGKTFVVTA